MKSKILILAVLSSFFLMNQQAHAMVGGPFDNGDYSILLEEGGTYQATFTFRNGSGMALFTEDNSFEVGNNTNVTGMFALHNRSIFYYKGLTYAGTATGVVDFGAKLITGFTNGNSEFATTTGVAVNPQGTVFGSARPSEIVHNANTGFVANSTFTAKITCTEPTLRFSGKGEVTFMGIPQLQKLRDVITAQAAALPTLAALAGTNGTITTIGSVGGPSAPPATGIINPPVSGVTTVTTVTSAITTAIPSTGTLLGDLYQSIFLANGGTITSDQASQVVNTLLALTAQVDNPSTLQDYQENLTMQVYGSRRYF